MKPSTQTEYIQTDFLDGILTLQFNRPEKKNALTPAMYSALVDGLRRADDDNAVRVILLAGTEGCFTSGNDIANFLNDPPVGESSPVIQFLMAMLLARKPIVAAVSGIAVGIGTTMLLHCDLVYAGASAVFQMPFVNLGLCPEAGSSLLLPRMMGHQRAAELLLLGEQFNAEAACKAGIVNIVCPDDELLETARTKAGQLAAQPSAAVCLAKSLLKRRVMADLRETMVEEARCFGARLRSPEATEAMTAFLERRKPDFSRFN